MFQLFMWLTLWYEKTKLIYMNTSENIGEFLSMPETIFPWDTWYKFSFCLRFD